MLEEPFPYRLIESLDQILINNEDAIAEIK